MNMARKWTGHEATLLRQALRLSLRAFAARLGVAERTVSHWEKAGRQSCPWPDNQEILDTALAQAPDDAKARFEQLLAETDTAATIEEDTMRRRELLRTLLTSAGVGVSLPALSAIDDVRRSVDLVMETAAASRSTLDHWEQAPYTYAMRYLATPPTAMLAELIADLAELQHLLAQPQTTRSRMPLCRASAQLALLAGMQLHTLGKHVDARRWFRTAVLAADEAGDTVLATHARGRGGNQHPELRVSGDRAG